MLKNSIYNFMMQLVVESKSCQRIRDHYLAEARKEGHDDCVAFWEKMLQDKQDHIAELSGLIKEHLCAEEK